MRIAILFLIASCGRVGFDARESRDGSLAPDVVAACTAFTPWSVAVPVNGLNSATTDAGPALTRDGRTIYFQSFRGGTSLDIYVATRPDRAADFGLPVALSGGVNTAFNDRDIALAAGDTRLYLSSDETAALQAVVAVDTIFVATGSGDTFGPRSAVAELGTNVYGPWVSDDELEMYYSSNGMLQRAVRSTTSVPWTPMGTSSLGPGGYPSFSADGHTIYFESANGLDVLTATRAQLDDAFSTPTPVELGVSFAIGVGDPFITADGLELYFLGNNGSDDDLYRLTRACL